MFSQPYQRWALALLSGAALFFLYFFSLTGMGLLGPDEPRYAAIGRAMADTGDWITPMLWGHPWFEKPALLYWMTALGFKAGLDPDLAPRLPVALTSVAFLVYFFVALRSEFGDRAAFYSSTILATSAGWLAFSRVAVTDLPMSAAFAAAMLAVMSGRERVLAGVMLGAAVLAKGLVPLVLFVPALWLWRKQWRDLMVLLAMAFTVAAPWYVAVTVRNGAPFVEDFFWKHHFARFFTSALQHEQPFAFYVPVLLAGLFPWSPLLLLLFEKRTYLDKRIMFLLVWVVWAVLFFSLSRNKLPGYVLPIFPALAALLGIALAEAKDRTVKTAILLAACAGLLVLIPAIQDLLPQALLAGLSHAQIRFPFTAWLIPAFLTTLLTPFLEWKRRRGWAVAAIALLTTAAVVWLVSEDYPLLDRTVSARAYWLSHGKSATCVPAQNRSWHYSLSYYANLDLPDCN